MPTTTKAAKTARVRNLLQRGNGWYVRYQVPLSVQPVYGKKEVVRTLGTSDKREALVRLHAAYAAIQREVAEAVRLNRPVNYASPAEVAAELESIGRLAREGGFPVSDEDDPAAVSLADFYVEETLEAHYATHGRRRDPDTGRPHQLDPAVEEAAGNAYRAIHDPKYKPISAWAAAHLASAEQSGLKASTLKKRKRFIDEFMAWAGTRLDPRQVTVDRAVAYTDHLRELDATTHSPRVKKDALTNLHTFFGWLKANRRLISVNPFHGLSAQIEGRRRGSGERRRPWTRDELTKLLTGLNPASRLWTAVVLGLYTGMRVDEISGMEVRHVDGESMRVVDAKNENSERHVPIHPVIAPLVATLVDTSYDGYLISGITPTGYDKKHGVYISKRFSIQRPKLGLSDPATTFHSLRHNFTSAAENAEIPETTAALLTGHKRQNITFGRYSEGREWTGLVAAMGRISHKDDVDSIVRRLVTSHRGNAAWQRSRVPELLQD